MTKNLFNQIKTNTNQIKAVQGKLDRGLRQLMGSADTNDEDPSFASDVQTGGIASNITQGLPEQPLGQPFDPGATQAGQEMFGSKIPGSFDRSLG